MDLPDLNEGRYEMRSVGTPAAPATPTPQEITALRDRIYRLSAIGQTIDWRMDTPMPAGPMTPELRETVHSMAILADGGSRVSGSIGAGVRSIRERGDVPEAISQAARAIEELGVRFNRHAGYLSGLYDTNLIPTSPLALKQVRADALTAPARAEVALAALNAAGWTTRHTPGAQRN